MRLGFSPASPPEIRAAHYRAASRKQLWMLIAQVFTYLGAGLVVVAILTAAFAAEDDSPAGTFSASLDGSGRGTTLLVGGEWAAGTRVVFTIESSNATGGAPPRRFAYTTPPDGDILRSFRVGEAASHTVRATWDEEKIGTRSLEVTVKPPKTE